jgi:hypothetical protein
VYLKSAKSIDFVLNVLTTKREGEEEKPGKNVGR